MAASVIKGMEELITCVICHGTFEDPCLLSCGHTYCRKCLIGCVNTNENRFECPLRDGVTVAASEINALQVNRTIRDLVDLYRK